MTDHYLNAAGAIDHVEGRSDGQPVRIFKPIATHNGITVYEQQHPVPVVAPETGGRDYSDD